MMVRSLIFIMCVVLLGCSTAEKKIIVCWGDSLTMQHKDYGIRGNIKKWLSGNFIDDSYPGFLEEMLGEEYKIINCGVGGENSLTIAARQGSIPMFLNEEVVFESGVDEVSIENDNLRSTWDSTVVAPLHQSRWKEGSPARINPCYVDDKEMFLICQRVECEDSTIFRYSLKRTTKLQDRHVVKKGSLLLTEASKNLRNQYLNIFFVGQNGGFRNTSEYISQLKCMIEYGKTKQYIVVSFHKPNNSVKGIREMKAMEDSLALTFGNHYINLRDYMVTRGLKDASLNATAEDMDSIKQGTVPPQLMTDGTHFNVYGCKLIAGLIADKMRELGY